MARIYAEIKKVDDDSEKGDIRIALVDNGDGIQTKIYTELASEFVPTFMNMDTFEMVFAQQYRKV